MSDKVKFGLLTGKRKKSPKLSKTINPDLFLRKYLVCPICGHSLTGSTSKGNGGKYTYYHCSHDGKHLRKSADVVNKGFAKFVGTLKPNEAVLCLYNEILQDLQSERKKEQQRDVEVFEKRKRRLKRCARVSKTSISVEL